MLRLASILTVCMLAQTAAGGGTVQISGSGTWGPDAPSTALSAPGETWSFSFNATTPVDVQNGAATEPVSNPSYSLNGTPVVSETMSSVTFFDSSLAGLFDLEFPVSGSISDEVSLYGAQIFDASGNLIPGSYPAAIDFDGKAGPPSGSGSGTVIVGASALVPEPSSVIGGGIAVLAVAGLGLVRRRTGAR